MNLFHFRSSYKDSSIFLLSTVLYYLLLETKNMAIFPMFSVAIEVYTDILSTYPICIYVFTLRVRICDKLTIAIVPILRSLNRFVIRAIWIENYISRRSENPGAKFSEKYHKLWGSVTIRHLKKKPRESSMKVYKSNLEQSKLVFFFIGRMSICQGFEEL